MRYWSLVVFILFFIVNKSWSQAPDKKNNKDFYDIKAPSIEYQAPDAGDMMFDSHDDTSDVDESINFDPHRDANMVDEDTSSSDEGELSIVEVAEQLKLDSVWVTIAEYYAIWDSRSVNPYKIDGAKFNDTINIGLYDSLAGFGWSMPLTGCNITSEFGMRHSRWHYGTDLKLQIGDPVLASFDGIVRIAKYDGRGYGNYVMLRHYNGIETLYGHLSETHVQVGQIVKAGQVIGLGGNTGRSTGPHLHYEIRYEGNAIDPEEVYNFVTNTIRGRNFILTPASFKYLKVARQVYYHKIRSGETLGSISRKYRVSISTICKLNKITTRTTLRVGRRLRIR